MYFSEMLKHNQILLHDDLLELNSVLPSIIARYYIYTCIIYISFQAGIVLDVPRLVVAKQLHLHCLFYIDWLKMLMECFLLLLLLLGEC